MYYKCGFLWQKTSFQLLVCWKPCLFLSYHFLLFVYPSVSCVTNADCSFMEACINKICQHPCDVHNPCAQNAICSNTNHGASCGCIEGYEGNAYVGCTEGLYFFKILVFFKVYLNLFKIFSRDFRSVGIISRK